MSWLTEQDPRLAHMWPDGALLPPEQLAPLLAAARHACAAFAPRLVDPENPPVHYVLAQARHARDIYLSSVVGTDDQLGMDGGIAVRFFPLDWQTKQLLRPQGPPVIA